MAREDRLELVKEALHILVDQLNPDDRIGLVTYDTGGQVLLEPTSLEDRDGRERILDAIDRLQPSGSTNAAEGLKLGYDMARRSFRQGSINRIILCTDGVANEGVTGAESILEEVRHEADRGIELTAIGFGMGNYNDVLLEKLADKGDGNYYYVDRLDEARRIFIEKLTGTIQTIAKDAKVQVAFDPHRVLRYRLLGFENRDVADRDFRNDKVDAGEIGAGHEVTALYELKLADSEDAGTIATVRVRHARPDGDGEGGPDVREIQRAFDARDLSRSLDRASPRFRLDAAVAEFAEILRRSFWAKESRISDVLPLARSVAEQIPGDPDVQEFARIVEKAADLSDKLSPQEQRERESYDMPWSTEKTLRGDRPNGER
jgi:Ca-activated chloride channel family protein